MHDIFSEPTPDTNLPTDHPWVPFNTEADLSPHGFLVGTSGYYFDDWIGVFNPPDKAQAQQKFPGISPQAAMDRFLFYQQYFRFVELNTTFYREPDRHMFHDLALRCKPGTRMAVKVHRNLSHNKSAEIDSARALMRTHADAVSPLVEKNLFFTFLLQLDDRVFYTTEKLEYLRAVGEEAISHARDIHIEFRHRSWHTHAVLQALKDTGIGICNTEIPPFSHVFPLKSYVTSDKGYIRYSGLNKAHWYPKKRPGSSRERIAQRNARYNYNYTPEQIGTRVTAQKHLRKKVPRVAIAYNNHYQANAVRNALENLRQLKRDM